MESKPSSCSEKNFGELKEQYYFVICHPKVGKTDRSRLSKKALHKLGIVNFIEILPADYKDFDVIRKIPQRDLFQVLIVPYWLRSEVETILPLFPNIRWIQALVTKVDTFFKIPSINNGDILLTNVRTNNDEPLAEFAMAGSLHFAKRFNEYTNVVNKRTVKAPSYDIGTLYKKTALIIGLGGIGQAIAKKCKYGFSMKTIGLKRDLNNLSKPLQAVVDEFYLISDLKEIIKRADFVYAALPDMEDKRKLFTEEVFANMRRDAVFVNVGRGSYVDEGALIRTLREGRICGAALDVTEKEPLDDNSEFYTDEEVKQRVILTHHTISLSKKFLEHIQQIVEKNIVQFVTEEPLMYAEQPRSLK